MTDERRNPEQPDRRISGPSREPSGRRKTDHGTRTAYTYGCRCPLCTDAEARYRANLRIRKAKGLPILGQHVSASEAWARIRVLRQEGFGVRVQTGHRSDHAIWFGPRSRVRLATLLRLRALCRHYLIEDSEIPNHQALADDSPV